MTRSPSVVAARERVGRPSSRSASDSGDGPPEDPTPVETPEDPGSAAAALPSWSVQFRRLSGLLLAVLLPIHVVDRFLVHDTAELSGLFLEARWTSTPWLLFEFALLTLAVLHGLLGIRDVLRRRLPETAALASFALGATLVTVLYLRTLYTMLLYPA